MKWGGSCTCGHCDELSNKYANLTPMADLVVGVSGPIHTHIIIGVWSHLTPRLQWLKVSIHHYPSLWFSEGLLHSIMERPRKQARIEYPSTPKSSVTPTSEQTKPVFEQVSALSSRYRMNDMADSEVYYVPDFINDSKKAEEWYAALLGLDSCAYFWIL